MELNEEDKAKITRILKRRGRKLWTDSIILVAIDNVQKIKDGRVRLDEWCVPQVLSWQDYLYELALHKFI